MASDSIFPESVEPKYSDIQYGVRLTMCLYAVLDARKIKNTNTELLTELISFAMYYVPQNIPLDNDICDYFDAVLTEKLARGDYIILKDSFLMFSPKISD